MDKYGFLIPVMPWVAFIAVLIWTHYDYMQRWGK